MLEVSSTKIFHYLQFSTKDVSYRQKVTIAGFPNYRDGSHPNIIDAIVTNPRVIKSSAHLFSLDKGIYSGGSGGPILDSENKVVGVAKEGPKNREFSSEDSMANAIKIMMIKTMIENNS